MLKSGAVRAQKKRKPKRAKGAIMAFVLQILDSKKGTGVINLTPHAINIVCGDGILEIPASGQVARCAVKSAPAGSIHVDGVQIPVVQNQFGPVEGLPAPQDWVIYIVSALVGSALAGQRDDIYGPDTSPAGAIRDESGKIVAVRGLQKF